MALSQRSLDVGASPYLKADPFSFTVLGNRWIDHEWFFEAALYAVFHWFSFRGILILKSVLLALSAAGVYATLPRAWSPVLKSAVVIVLFAGLQFRNMVRPDLVSFALFPWFFRALLLFQEAPRVFHARGDFRTLWPYALGMVVWANCHAAFLLMWTLIALAALSRAIQSRWDLEASVRTNSFLWLLGTCVAVSMINPYGYHLLTGAWQTTHWLLTRDHDDFIEYTTTSYHRSPLFWTSMICAAAVVGLVQWSEKSSMRLAVCLSFTASESGTRSKGIFLCTFHRRSAGLSERGRHRPHGLPKHAVLERSCFSRRGIDGTPRLPRRDVSGRC